ncbi:hypothetical protein PJ900_22405 [Tistrella mobilis]|uniref:Methylaspartate ammonia-lyase n=1 Tax=Tistrella mobilis TaxID=171437 RepID=A0A162LIJ1_9PROT|nr:hypothetical protein [Tistrella mobilis]KYO55124.1 hypothetical protein AUP44_24220 [Tistrella mobilis]
MSRRPTHPLRPTLSVLVAALTALGIMRAPAAAPVLPQGVVPLCRAMAGRVDAIDGAGPVFLRSWDAPAGSGPHPDPALAGAAFAYDNALALRALIACGRSDAAARIATAFADAVLSEDPRQVAADRGRVRNAYRAGAQTESPPPPNGWWDAAAGRWVEDPYQTGTATGNAAWVGLALLAVAERPEDPAFPADLRRQALDAARRIGGWVIDQTADEAGPGGYTGGVDGAGAGLRRIGWKSTEHHADLVALFTRLTAADPGTAGWGVAADRARRFLDRMWQAGSDHFPTGTLPDGATLNTRTSGLDAQLWPLLLQGAPVAWRSAWAWAGDAHGVDGGFDFNDDRDGVWIEGTAQAALVAGHLGQTGEAQRLLDLVLGEVSPGGWLWATRRPSITTGLAIGPDSVIDDFRYHRWPHLGATAWAVLAATGANPFTTAS